MSTTLPATAANFTFSPTNPAINQDVVFNASGTPVPGGPGPGPFPFPTGGGAPVQGATYTWDFGDGTTGTGTSTTHRYTRGGTFAITLRVTSDTGLTATTSRQVTISTTLPAGSANFVFSPTDPQPDDVVFFNASSSTLSNGSYTWDFGDGNSGSGVTTDSHLLAGEDLYGDADGQEYARTERHDLEDGQRHGPGHDAVGGAGRRQ